MTIIQNPRQFKVPDWMLNRKKDVKDGKFSQVVSNTLDMKLREDLERLKKIRAHRGLRHYCAPPPPESLPTRPRAVALGPLRADGFRTTVLSPAQPFFFCRGPARAWSAHQDDRPQGPHRRCVQEEGLDIFAYVATSDMLPQRAGSTVRAVYAFLRECLTRLGAPGDITPLALSLHHSHLY